METPWSPDRKTASQKQEARTAKKPGARPQLNSGRTWSGKGDVKQYDVLIDNKTTEARSYTIKLDGEHGWLAHKTHANRTPPGCLPALQVDISGVRLVVVEESFYDELIEGRESVE